MSHILSLLFKVSICCCACITTHSFRRARTARLKTYYRSLSPSSRVTDETCGCSTLAIARAPLQKYRTTDDQRLSFIFCTHLSIFKKCFSAVRSWVKTTQAAASLPRMQHYYRLVLSPIKLNSASITSCVTGPPRRAGAEERHAAATPPRASGHHWAELRPASLKLKLKKQKHVTHKRAVKL